MLEVINVGEGWELRKNFAKISQKLPFNFAFEVL
jgi:hypothetical protein